MSETWGPIEKVPPSESLLSFCRLQSTREKPRLLLLLATVSTYHLRYDLTQNTVHSVGRSLQVPALCRLSDG
ncbi:hypothetical protein BJX96DRAFT_159371 [Aspergillus floccosus]